MIGTRCLVGPKMSWVAASQRNLDDAQNKCYDVEQKLKRILWEYIDAFDKERGRPRLTMTKLWQMMQSRETENLNLDTEENQTDRLE